MTTIQHLKLVGDLGVAVSTLSAATSPLDKIKAAAAVRDLLARIGARVKAAAPSITIDMDDAASTVDSIRAYAQEGLQQMPKAHQRFEAVMVSTLAAAMGERDLAREVAATGVFSTDADFLAAYEATAARAVDLPLDGAQVSRKIEAAKAAKLARIEQYKSAMEAKKVELDDENARAKETLSVLGQKTQAARTSGTMEDYHATSAEYDSFQEQYLERWKALRQQLLDAHAEYVTAFNSPEESDDAKADGDLVIDAVMQASPITAQQAKDWAERQVVAPATAALLKKRGYKIDALRADMADFYRLTGGKIAEIEISTARSGRAHASGILETGGRKTVAVGKHFNRTVLFHELAHHLETDAIARASAHGFLIKRRESSSTYRLRDLTGNNGYGPAEVAWKDKFLNPYIGKVYRDGVTEVFSMGVQMLADPVQAAKLAAEDPEMFALISGYISQPMSPAMQALVVMHTGAVSNRRDAEQEAADQFDAAIKQLAEPVTLTKAVIEDSWLLDIVDGSFKAGKPRQYLGSFGQYHVFTGILRNRQTKRWSIGHLVAHEVVGRPDTAAFHDGLDVVRAAISLCQSQGESPSRVFYRFFMPGMRSGDYRKTLIDLVSHTS